MKFHLAVLFLILFLLPPSAWAAYLLPDTGQTKCYQAVDPYDEIPCAGTGQDGAYSINPMSYTDHGNGTVTDNNTGLIWQKCSVGQINDATCSGTAATYNWYEASGKYDSLRNPSSQDVCGTLSWGGHTDWYLPPKKELMSIVDYSRSFPELTINEAYFPNTLSSSYWSSTEQVGFGTSNSAWYINFASGFIGSSSKYSGYPVRCVRGQSRDQSFVDNFNGTVTDLATGLVWQQNDGWVMPWGDALAYCEGLTLGGRTDWRLPNAKELVALTYDKDFYPAIVYQYFSSTQWSSYWTSSTSSHSHSYATIVNFSYGGFGNNSKNDKYTFARCVSGGQFGSLGYLIMGNAGVAGVTVALSGSANATTTSTGDGSYNYTVLSNGSYAVTPTLKGYTFAPASRGVTVAGTDVTVPAFTATYVGYSISGNTGFSGATVTLSGVTNRTITSAADGSYSFTGLVNGSYTVTPTFNGYTFTPISQRVTISGDNILLPVFTSAYVGLSISGNAGISGATVTLSGAAQRTITTKSDGSYSFGGLANGNYTVTPNRSGYMFTPSSRSVAVASANVTAIDFSAALVYTISGNAGIAGATVTLTGDTNRTTASAADGSYSFTGLANGSYTVKMLLFGYTFTPPSRIVTLSGADSAAVIFTAILMHNLDVTITGSGLVSINPPAIDCTSGTCQYTYPMLTSVNLTASFDNLTLFTWGGACSGSNTLCSLTMNSNKAANAIFTAAPKVKVGTKEFATVQSAYDDVATMAGANIRMLNDVNVGPLAANLDMSVTLSGGQNAIYAAQPGMTLLQGPITVHKGSIVVDRVVVK
jgi:hypothetical protein